MSLTGRALPTLLALAAIGLFVVLVTGWPYPHRPWHGAAARAVTAVVLNLCVLGLAGSLLNDQYAFYVGWGDLFGAQSPTVGARGGASAAQAAAGHVTGRGLAGVATPAVLPPLPQPGRRLQRYVVQGARSGFRNEVLVYLPAGYDPRAQRTYPVLLALHGFPGHPEVFEHLDDFLGTVDRAVATRTMAAPIVVVPEINSPAGLDTECVDAPGGPHAETWLAHDVPDWVVQHFRATRRRTSWATWGFSFGGWCSAMLGIRHPDVFGASVVVQGYFRPDFDAGYEPFRPGSPLYRSYDLVDIALHHPPALSLWILASKQDSLSYPSTNALVKDARAPLSVTAELLKEGGHRASVWLPQIPVTFRWLGRTLPGFAP